jgi:hypothetical protein
MSMTPEDRDFLHSLRRQQMDLQHSLEKLQVQLDAWEARAEAAAPEVFLPPLPPLPLEPELPPLPVAAAVEPALPPVPTAPVFPSLSSLPPPAPAQKPQPSLEFRFGRWLTRMGAVLFVLLLISFATWVDVKYHIHERLGPLGKVGLIGLVSALVLVLGQRFERKQANFFFGRTLMAAGLAGLYVTFYGAYSFDQLRVIQNPMLEGVLLLSWSFYVLWLAERKKSQGLALFAITLAYVSTAINPIDRFTMAADLVLAATALVFILRHGWVALSTFSLIGTYLALLRRLVVDENGELVLDTSRTLHFLPHAVYLVGAWFIFTVAAILTKAPGFRGGQRLAFVSLNNGAVAGLLVLTAYIAGYGASSMGWTLLDAGFVFLITSRFAGFAEIDPVDLMAAYAAQGLALVTAGVIVVYTGITRGVLLLIETFFLGMAAAFSGDRILTISTYVAGFFATLFLIWEIAANAHHPWLLGFGGAAVMLLNAWWCRSEVRDSPLARSSIVLSSSCYCVLALGLIFTALSTELSDGVLPPALALAGLALTFLIYYVSLFELPPLAQTLVLAAQFLVLFPAETGEELPWWSAAWVAGITLVLITWWTRQRVTRSGSWTLALTAVYALALVGLANRAVHPYLDGQDWLVGASVLSLLFLIYGAFTRTWPLAAAGQLFLAVALYHFFFPPYDGTPFPWTWWAAAMPVASLFATARAALTWLRLFPEIPGAWRRPLSVLAYGYLLLALAGLIRWVFAVVPAEDQMASFLFLGTLVLSSNVRHPSTFGVRCSFVLSAVGMWLYLDQLATQARALATFLNALALLGFLAQPALLRQEGRLLVTRLESWALIVFSVGTGWIFVSSWVLTRLSPGYLTMGWALYALFLFLFGLLVWERRLRWCGLALVLAAILRVGCYDMWGLSNGYRVLTFFVLTVITLGLGYVILRLADRRQSWL